MKRCIVLLAIAVFGFYGVSTESYDADLAQILSASQELGEGNHTVVSLIESDGYPVETHTVTTSDGYILTLHRIPHGRTERKLGKVAYLQHGILASSADWCLLGPGKALAYELADEGYDVWMGNARGTTWSRAHVLYPPEQARFWQFSWHEIGTIDVPAMIDYVLEKTGESQLSYVGHSQGTTVYYVMTSSLPAYNDKIKVAVNLAPIAFMKSMKSPLLKVMAQWTGTIDLLLKMMGVNEFMPTSDFKKYVMGDKMCQEDAISQLLCTNALFAVCGFSRSQMNTTLLPTIMKYTPAGAATKQMVHYGQEIKSGYFRQFDYGATKNMAQYLRLAPPRYTLAKITTPTFLFYSKNDWLSAESDVDRLCKGMGTSCRGKILMSDFQFNHLDYMFGIDAPALVYNKVISVLARY